MRKHKLAATTTAAILLTVWLPGALQSASSESAQMKINDGTNAIRTGTNVTCYNDGQGGQVTVGVPPPGSQFRYDGKNKNPSGATVFIGGACFGAGCTETPPSANVVPLFQSATEYDGPNGSPLDNRINLRGMSQSLTRYMRFQVDWTPADKKQRRLAYMNANDFPSWGGIVQDCPGADAAPVKVECTGASAGNCTSWKITGANACYFKQDKISGVTTWVLLGVVSVPVEILLGAPGSLCP